MGLKKFLCLLVIFKNYFQQLFSSSIRLCLYAPIVQRPRMLPFQGSDPSSNLGGGVHDIKRSEIS